MEAFLEPERTADHRLESGALTRLESLLEGLRDRTVGVAEPVSSSGRGDEFAAPGSLSDLYPADDVTRVDLPGTGGLKVLLVHRLAREYAFLDTGNATFPLDTEDQVELLQALQELKAPGSRPPDLKKFGNTPHSVRGFLLTGRQIEILRLAARGETNIRISQMLAISISTVKRELKLVFDELNVSGRADAAAKAYQAAII